MKWTHAFLAGLVFGAGLLISGMASPARVLGFLDLGALRTGHWDPSLGFVMGGALVVAAPLFAYARKRGRALDGGILPALPSHGIDRRLVGGAALFGLGWGLAGICPGPALVDLGVVLWPALAFAVPMGIGLLLGRRD
jgi:uncharacterized membrane protein YedE/YeeE